MPPNRAAVLKARVAQRPQPNTGGTSAPVGPVAQGRPVKNKPKTGLGQRKNTEGPFAGPIGGNAGGNIAPGGAAGVHMPWDAQYELAAAGAEKAYGDKTAYLRSKRLLAQQGYGIDPGFNDYANNPFSRAALLRKHYDTAVRGTTNSYAAQGQLYAGSVHNAQGANRSGYDQGYDELNRDYLASLGEIDREGAEALEARENAINEAGWERLQTAQGEPLEPQTAPANNVNKKAKQKRKDKKGKK